MLLREDKHGRLYMQLTQGLIFANKAVFVNSHGRSL